MVKFTLSQKKYLEVLLQYLPLLNKFKIEKCQD